MDQEVPDYRASARCFPCFGAIYIVVVLSCWETQHKTNLYGRGRTLRTLERAGLKVQWWHLQADLRLGRGEI